MNMLKTTLLMAAMVSITYMDKAAVTSFLVAQGMT